MLADREFEGALAELEARLAERPEFYRGTMATAVVAFEPTSAQLDALRALLKTHGIGLAGIELGVSGGGEELARRRAQRPSADLKLSESARSLVADFAGARADIAHRRRSGLTSVRRSAVPQAPAPAHAESAPSAALHVAAQPPGTLFHVGTLRGGQALHHVGNIVVVGDVNPGTELVATGDVLVFGRLLGVAHAGAQGDDQARVYALHLQATQLRIATSIAVDEETRRASAEPEVAFVRDGRIVIAPFSKVGEVRAE